MISEDFCDPPVDIHDHQELQIHRGFRIDVVCAGLTLILIDLAAHGQVGLSTVYNTVPGQQIHQYHWHTRHKRSGNQTGSSNSPLACPYRLTLDELDHVRTFQVIAKLPVVVPCSHSRDNCYLVRAMFALSYSLGLFHQKAAVALETYTKTDDSAQQLSV